MVTRTFRQPGANEPVDAQRLTSSPAPFCHPRTVSQVAGGDTLWSSAPFINRGERIRRYQDDVGRLVLIIFKIFAGFYSCHPKTFKPNDARDSSLLGRDYRVQWRREVWSLSNFVVFRTLKFFYASYAFSFLSEWQVSLTGILISRVMFRSNKISVLSLLRFYLQ